jgi:hypothetical protein
MHKKVIVAYYDAMGGPSKPEMGDDGFMKHPTTKGDFVLASCGKHVSTRYPFWSSIPWGTRLKEDKGILKVLIEGKWQPLSKYTTVTKDELKEEYYNLYKKNALPDRWLFNDFGHMTCYYFRDINHNRVLDSKSEHITGEFIHTTPIDEANTALNNTVELEGSHGCIHVKPNDIDEMIKKGYLKKGNLVVVHSYRQEMPIGQRSIGKAPFEFHFYPKSNKVVIYGTK